MLVRLAKLSLKRSVVLKSQLRVQDPVLLLKQRKTLTNRRSYSNSPLSVVLPDPLKQKPVTEWSVDDVQLWSANIDGLTQYERDQLKKDNVTGPALLALRNRGKLLLKAVQQLKDMLWVNASVSSILKDNKLRGRSLHPIAKSAVGAQMQLVGREEAVAVAWEPIVQHFTKQSHSLIFAVGARGIGKTRFGAEFDQLLLSYGQQNHAMQQPELIKALKNVMYIPISFEGDCRYESFDGRYKGQKQVDWMLTVRAIYNLFDIKDSFKAFASKLQSEFGSNLPEFFNLQALKDYLITGMDSSAKPSMIYWHLDDIHWIYQKTPDLAANMITHLKDLYSNQDQVPTLLLIGGETFSDIRNTIMKKSGQQMQSVVLPFNVLSNSAVGTLVNSMCKQHNLEWVQDQQEFKDIIQDCGGVPKLIQTVFEQCLELRGKSYFGVDIKNLARAVASKTFPSWPEGPQMHEAFWLAFLGNELMSDPTLSNGSYLSKEQLKSNAYVFFKDVATAAVRTVVPFMPFMFFRNTRTNDIANLAKIYQPVWQEFVNQGFHLFGSDLWKLVLQLHVFKTTSFKQLGLSFVPFAEYYKKSTFTNLQNFKTAKFEVCAMDSVLMHDWSQLTKKPLQPFNSIYLTKTGAIDSFQFVKTDHHQHPVTVVLHQNHFTGDGKADSVFDAKTVNLELESIEKEFNDWLAKNDLPKGWTKPVSFVTVFYTNRAMEPNFENELANNCPEAMKKDFIIVSDPAYFGPFESVFNRVRAQ